MEEHRRYLVIKFRIGTCESGYLVGPVLVSTSDYHRFHFWDEPDEAYLDAGDYEVVRVYPLGCECAEAERRFTREFAPGAAAVDRVLQSECEGALFASPSFFPSFDRPPLVQTA